MAINTEKKMNELFITTFQVVCFKMYDSVTDAHVYILIDLIQNLSNFLTPNHSTLFTIVMSKVMMIMMVCMMVLISMMTTALN